MNAFASSLNIGTQEIFLNSVRLPSESRLPSLGCRHPLLLLLPEAELVAEIIQRIRTNSSIFRGSSAGFRCLLWFFQLENALETLLSWSAGILQSGVTGAIRLPPKQQLKARAEKLSRSEVSGHENKIQKSVALKYTNSNGLEDVMVVF